MKQRIITALVAAAVFLPIVLIGSIPLLILIYLMASVALFELFRMRKLQFFSIPGIISIVLLWIFLFPTEYISNLQHIDGGKTEIFLLGVLLFLSYSVISKNNFSFEDVAYSILSVLYIGIGFYYLFMTREAGVVFIFFALLLIWSTDSGAYFVGRAIGKRKLWPDISPNKTVEGMFGGIFFAYIVSFIFYFFTEIGDVLNIYELLIFTFILSIFGQLGDLVESGIKRHYQVKDSGTLLPGHGGILDRVDSWLFVMPLLHFLHIL